MSRSFELLPWDKENEDYVRFQDRILSLSAAKRLDHALFLIPIGLEFMESNLVKG
jgi:hypothetical protein